jgi:hypothetical protein
MQVKTSTLKTNAMLKSFGFLFLLLISISLHSQIWLDYNLTPRGDTINRVDRNNLKQGPWVQRFEEIRGEPGYEEEGYFRNSKKEGLWRRYSLMGDLIAKEFYKGGYRDGKQLYYTRMGDLLREESYKAVDPEHPYDTIMVPDLDHPERMVSKIIRHEAAEVRNGLWTFYDPSFGSVVKTENYIFGQLEKKPNAAPGMPSSQQPVQKKQPELPSRIPPPVKKK